MSTLLEQASLVMIPSGYKEDVVYSQIPTDGSGDLSFTRASNGTRVNSAGLVEVTPWNLVQYSEDFSTGWSINNSATITSNSTTAPNGTTTADTLNSSNLIYSGVYQSIGTLASNVYTYSIYAKAGTNTYLVMLAQGSGGQRAFFNLNTGTVGTTLDIDSASIENVGNGWYRCQIQKTGNGIEMFVFSSNIENTTPTASGNIYIWGAQTNIGSTAKPYFPTTDRLNVPRLTYQNGGGGCPSLLLEKQSTNLFTYSEQFDNAGWTKLGSSITANSTTSPDGTQNADSIIDNTTNTRHVIEQPLTGDLSISRAMSLYAKQNSLRYLFMSVTNAGDTDCYSAIFDLQSGTVSATKVNGSATINASIESVGNGWYRCIITGTMTSGTTIFYPLIGTSNRGGFTGTLVNNNAPSYAGSGQSLFIWGSQLEASSYPTSYIPTTTSSATRVADACFKTGISSLIGQTAGVVFADFVYLGGVQAVAIELSNSASADDIINLYITSSASTQCYMFDGGSQVGFINSSHTFVQGSRYKVAIGYASNDLVLYINGTQIGTATPSSIPTTSEIYISRDKAASYLTDTKYNEVVIFPTRLTNAELASITTI